MEILLAAFAGYLFAQVLMWQKKRALAIGERFLEQNQLETTRNLRRNFEELLGEGGPVLLTAERETLTIKIAYESKRCPGPHCLEMSKDDVLARQHLAKYIGERVEAGRFSHMTMNW